MNCRLTRLLISIGLTLVVTVDLGLGATIGDRSITNRFGKKYKTCDKELQVRKFILCATVDLYIDDWTTSNLIAKAGRHQAAGREDGAAKIEDCCVDGCSDLSLLGFCLDEREQYTINKNSVIDDETATELTVPKQHQPKSRRNRFELGTVSPEYQQAAMLTSGGNTNVLDY